MPTTTVKLKETAVTAYIVINAMKQILEENGFELVHEKLSLQADTTGNTSQNSNKVYCLSYLVERTFKNLQPLISDQEYELIPCEPSEEVLNAKKVLGDLIHTKANELTFPTGESYSLHEHDVWIFNRNFNNFWSNDE